ncbi:hypothetical protein HQ346_14460 [Rhodococcus sp. BP-252]|uniref:hypothetical protein n=1 Tax=unclassified Rhodococcus (in: high G+C Gram-positive bacteria) TaxID=192944 RepID=UPI001C9A8F32|nr:MULTISPECIES: hypothetical protein [unclassified Rhodococcus (in: high G+C Gram-positive bacteria)]MBY6412885.1 hypothetical protein [Rhodococcus sp. BP-320]MBY6417578.1 hypothetical protein [Rhodococcus sp. BP-321]MBY6423050.1 hypothetical protein [Rhodococcus sp. BP-324]MBY6427602.1 hypothetical protein [Rhodococcus sp. BP-323]MBY6432766.1 hypothetical protein [Rhodococcus sp. BP-322]
MSTDARRHRALEQITRATARLDAAMCSGVTVDVTDVCRALNAWHDHARELGATDEQIDAAQAAGIS